jgi:hypothetical protein
VTFQEWFAAHRRRNPNAKINERTRDLYRAWLRNNPRDPGEGGPGRGRIPDLAGGSQPEAPQGGGGSGGGSGGGGGGGGQQQTTPPQFSGRTDAGRETGILNLYGQLNELPARYNLQRNRAATGTQAGLLDAGFFDQVGLSSQEAPSTAQKAAFKDDQREVTNPDGTKSTVTVRVPVLSDYAAGDAKPVGDITYKLKYGPDGRLYRQAYTRAADTFAARGVYSSSLLRDSQGQSRQSLDTARDQSIRNYNNTVNQIASNQSDDTTSINRQIGTENTGYTQWTGQQDVTLPSMGTPTTNSTDNSGANNVVTPPSGSSNTPPPGNLGAWTVRAAGANAIPRLTRQVRDRNPGVSFRVVRRGNRYVAVRT